MRLWVHEVEDMEKSVGCEGGESCLKDELGWFEFGTGKAQDDIEHIEAARTCSSWNRCCEDGVWVCGTVEV
jgi:hypothetical protein